MTVEDGRPSPQEAPSLRTVVEDTSVSRSMLRPLDHTIKPVAYNDPSELKVVDTLGVESRMVAAQRFREVISDREKIVRQKIEQRHADIGESTVASRAASNHVRLFGSLRNENPINNDKKKGKGLKQWHDEKPVPQEHQKGPKYYEVNEVPKGNHIVVNPKN